jgi:hypothetical protein
MLKIFGRLLAHLKLKLGSCYGRWPKTDCPPMRKLNAYTVNRTLSHHQVEDAAHIFFTCSLSQFAWSGTRELLPVDWNPSSFVDLFAIFNPFKGILKRFLWMLFAVQRWELWITRNKFSIEVKFPKHLANVLFQTTIILQL